MNTSDKKQNETAKTGGFIRILKTVFSLARQKKGRRLEKFLMRLPPAKIYWVETIMYLGSGSGQRVADIKYCYEHLSSEFPPEDAIRNILEKGPAPLDNYFKTGIKILKKYKVDIDALISATREETGSNPTYGQSRVDVVNTG